MFFAQNAGKTADLDAVLKSLFQQLDYVSVEEQYIVLLTISRILLQIHEDQEAKSYLLQAALIQETFEVYYTLSILALKDNNVPEARNLVEKTKNLPMETFQVFLWEDIASLIQLENLTDESRELYGLLDSLLHPQRHDATESLDNIVQQMGEKATPILLSLKEKSGLAKKYPHLDQLSIDQWEKELPNRKEKIQQMELLRNQHTPLTQQELINLGKMYLLENEFLKAEECFIQAKEVFLTTR